MSETTDRILESVASAAPTFAEMQSQQQEIERLRHRLIAINGDMLIRCPHCGAEFDVEFLETKSKPPAFCPICGKEFDYVEQYHEAMKRRYKS